MRIGWTALEGRQLTTEDERATVEFVRTKRSHSTQKGYFTTASRRQVQIASSKELLLVENLTLNLLILAIYQNHISLSHPHYLKCIETATLS